MSDEALRPGVPNPYASPAPLLAENEAPFQASPSDHPRVWTVFVAFLAAFGGTIALSVVGAVIVVLWYFAAGGTPSDLPRELPAFVTQPPQFILLAAFSQLAILLAAIVPAWLSPQPLKLRLGMTNPRLPPWHWPVLVFGGVIPFAFGIFCAVAVSWVIAPDESVTSLYEQMTPAMAIPFILFIAVFPGLNEEMLFRGYMQRRLLERWNPWVAILVASALFAILHIMPHPVALAFPVGIWLGILAWRTNSTWPGIVSHAIFNGLWNVYVIGSRLEYFPDPIPIWLQVIFFGSAGVCFLSAVALLLRMKPVVTPPLHPPE